VGTLEPGKNLDVALRALALLRGRGQAATLKVVGAKGWKQSHIPALVRGLGLEGAVEFSGYLDDAGLKAAYKAAIGLIFPSAYEGFGFPILEAQSQGCPVLSADNSSLREIGGEASRYFQTGDPEGLAALMASCLAGGQEWESARDEGFRNCGRFSWERSAEGTWAAYRSALGRRP
jgi:glycosyltransferase involved in cell wall biosynthesis